MEIEITAEAKKDLEYWKKVEIQKFLNGLENFLNLFKKLLLKELVNQKL